MRVLWLPALVLFAAGCLAGRPTGGADRGDGVGRDAGASATLTGRVTYLPRIALPPDAVLTVRLEDVSRADAPAGVLAEQTVATAGRQVPIPFSLSYAPDSVRARHRYAVRAEIRSDDGTLLWLSDTVHPVLTQGAPSDSVEVRVVQVDREPLETGDAGPLSGATWRLVEVATPDGRTLRPAADQPFTLAFDGDGRYGGQADCNRYGGSYELSSSGTLRLSQGLSTLAACPDPSLSDTFLRTLGGAETATVAGDRLRIQAGQGALVFERDAASE